MNENKLPYKVDIDPKWLEYITPEKYNDVELFKIVRFFVFQSPCKKASARRIELQEYGWNDPWKNPNNLRLLLISLTNNQEFMNSAKSYSDMEVSLEESNLIGGFFSDFTLERACFYNSEATQSLSLFKHIRNALAHSRFNIIENNEDCIFIMEDGIERKDYFKVSARIIIKKSTLLKWIDLITAGPKN